MNIEIPEGNIQRSIHVVMVTPFPKNADHIDGGVAGAAKYLCDELVKKDHITLTVVAPTVEAGHVPCEQWPGFKVYRLGESKINSLLPGAFYYAVIGHRKLNQLLAKLNPDIVHYQGLSYLAGKCKYPNVLTIHGIAEKDALWAGKSLARWFQFVLRRISENSGRKRVANIISISPYVAQVIGNKIKKAKRFFIENPVAATYFHLTWQPQKGRILSCGKIIPLKNTLGLLSSFVQIAKDYPQAQLRFAGGAEQGYLDKCKKFVVEHGLTQRVYFLGNLSIRNVQNELSKANCLVIPSFQENSPLVIEEAMAVGVPVIGSRICGLPYMIKDQLTGILIDPFDGNTITQAIYKILKDESFAKSLSEESRKEARHRFQANIIAKRTLDVYYDILKTKSS